MDKALRFYERFAERAAATPTEQYSRAMAFYRIGDIQYEMANGEEATKSSRKAIAILERLAAAHPREPLYLHQLANGYWRLGNRLDHVDLEKGKQAYLRAIELFGQLDSRFGATWDESRHGSHAGGLRTDRECGCFGWYRYAQADLWRSLSTEQENAGLIREAEAGARKALALAKQIASEFPQGYPRGAHGFHANLSGFLKRQGLPGAEQHLRQAEALFSRQPVVETDDHARLASVLNSLGKPEEALAHWESAFRDPETLGSWRTHAFLEFLVSCPPAQFEAFGGEDGVQVATKAVELYPGWTGNWRSLRRIAHRAGGPEHAASALQTALERMPEDAAQRWPDHLFHAWMNLGKANSRAGDLEAALSAFERAGQLTPNYKARYKALARNGVAWSIVTAPNPDLHDVPRAVEFARKAVDLEPENGFYWNTLGVAQYRAGDWKAAIDALEKSMELSSSQHDSFNTFFLSMAHWQLGHRDEARKAYDRGVEWMDNNMPRNEELLRFRAEAAQLLGIPTPTPKPEPDEQADTD